MIFRCTTITTARVKLEHEALNLLAKLKLLEKDKIITEKAKKFGSENTHDKNIWLISEVQVANKTRRFHKNDIAKKEIKNWIV